MTDDVTHSTQYTVLTIVTELLRDIILVVTYCFVA